MMKFKMNKVMTQDYHSLTVIVSSYQAETEDAYESFTKGQKIFGLFS